MSEVLHTVTFLADCSISRTEKRSIRVPEKVVLRGVSAVKIYTQEHWGSTVLEEIVDEHELHDRNVDDVRFPPGMDELPEYISYRQSGMD